MWPSAPPALRSRRTASDRARHGPTPRGPQPARACVRVAQAARVLDPIFLHINDNSWKIRGKFFKDYKLTQW